MYLQTTLLITMATLSMSRPLPRPTPISVYQQQDGADEQEPIYQPQQQQQYRQPVQYKQVQPQALRQPTRALYRPQQTPQQLQQTESEDYEMGPPQPYQFSFDVTDDENTNYQNRKEQREGNKITGSYSVVDSDGFVRTVTYTADPVEGFKAHVSREPTNIVIKFPTPTQSPDGGLQFGQSPKNIQYAQPSAQPGIQYNGAPVPRAPLRHSGGAAAARQKQTQQYLQAIQAETPIQYQSQGTVRHSQALSTAGQINQFLAETSPHAAARINQFSSSNAAALRG